MYGCGYVHVSPLSEQYQSPTLTISHRAGALYMESLPAAHSIGDVGGGRGIPTAGEDPEEPSGPETGCLSQILGLRLGNRGNFCYSNAVVRSWLHLAAWLGGLQQLFEGNMLAHLKGLMQAKGVYPHVEQPLFGVLRWGSGGILTCNMMWRSSLPMPYPGCHPQ